MARRKRRRRTTDAVEEKEPEDLNRFAGSSDEDVVAGGEYGPHERLSLETNQRESSNVFSGEENGSESGDDSQSVENKHDNNKASLLPSNPSSDDDSDNEERSSRTAGMAHAMSRILGIKSAAAAAQLLPVVLSKTKTPLQKIAEAEKKKEKELREKRRLNRDRDMTALHVPLSVATTTPQVPGQNNSASSSAKISKELQEERIYRRVATRGVVALFNAIAQHQTKPNEQIVDYSPEKKGSSAKKKKMTKHSFLEQIKSKAARVSEHNDNNSSNEKPKEKQQWQALSDDFMLNPKKNWDQESSSEDDYEGSKDEERSNMGRPAKQQRSLTS